MRWSGQAVERDGAGVAPPLPGLEGVVRSVRPPGFDGVVFHEVEARSVLNRVPESSPVPFRWTVNPYRGCSHACVYCFARRTHTYLDLDSGADFDRQIVVKVNAAGVLARELRSARWRREPVALGTNTDPYQRAEGRYRLMPGIIEALARSGTPFSVLTKGTVLTRDLPLLVAAAEDVPVSLGVSVALLDRGLQATLEPGTPSPAARLDLVRRLADAGLSCGVLVAPVLPLLTDTEEALDALLSRVAAAGASGASVMALHLRPGAREWFLGWLGREHPELVGPYARLYRQGAYAEPAYRRTLAARVAPLLRRHGLVAAAGSPVRHGAPAPPLSPEPPSGPSSSGPEQLTLL